MSGILNTATVTHKNANANINANTTNTPNKKLDTKKIRKSCNFIVLILCHYTLNIYSMKQDLGDINYPVLIELLNNCIFNVFTLCLANNINLDKTKTLIDDTCLLVTDYITISREEEFKHKADKLKLTNAIAYAYQKISDKIIASIPIITRHTNFIDSFDLQNGVNLRHIIDVDKPSSLPKSFGSSSLDSQSNTKWNSVSIPDETNVGIANSKQGLLRDKFKDLSTSPPVQSTPIKKIQDTKPDLLIRGINTSKTNKVIYLMCALITRIFSTLIKASFNCDTYVRDGYIQHISAVSGLLETNNQKLGHNLNAIESYINTIYPVLYTAVKNNIYMDAVVVENNISLVVLKSSRDYLVAIYIYLRELCKMHATMDRFSSHKVVLDIGQFIKLQDPPFETLSTDMAKNKANLCDIKWFDAIYNQFE